MRIVFDPGHGGEFPGAVFRGILEKDITLPICLASAELLRSKGHEITLTRDGDYHLHNIPQAPYKEKLTADLNKRAEIGNQFGDIFVSLHCNADPDPDEPGMSEAKGEEIWVKAGSALGLELAEVLKEHVDGFFPNEPFRGIKETGNIRVLNKSLVPACLIEVAFIDNSSSVLRLIDPDVQEDLALMLSTGIDEYSKRKGGEV